MSWFNWLLLAISTVIAAGIVERSRWSNWCIIPVVLVVWFLCYVVIVALKLTILMLPLIIIGAVVWGLVIKSAKKRA